MCVDVTYLLQYAAFRQNEFEDTWAFLEDHPKTNLNVGWVNRFPQKQTYVIVLLFLVLKHDFSMELYCSLIRF